MNLQTGLGKASVTQACALFGISREAYYAAKRPPATRDGGRPLPATAGEAAPRRGRPGVTAAALEEGIRAAVKANPARGVRTVWARLRRPSHGLQVGKRRGWAMMKALGLTPPAECPRELEPRRGHVAGEEPNRRWATDLTTVVTAKDGVVAVVPVIECGCRSVLAVAVTDGATPS